jgi:ElaB/YqjD/DUF883 family membrane-anchored ribosome-binding protein
MSNTTYRRDAAEEVSNLANDATNMASEVADSVSNAASRVQERASAIGKKAVDQFSATTDYFREHDMKEMASDLNSWVKSHPTQALVAAAAIGFVAGSVLRRR